jgi:hypothetical protein
MFSLAVSYKFNKSIEEAEMTIPQIEEYLSNFISEFIFDADMISVQQHTGKGFPDFSSLSDFEHPAVFIEFIMPAEASLFEQFVADEDAIANYITASFMRESLYLESFWSEGDDRCFVVRVIKISGKMTF